MSPAEAQAVFDLWRRQQETTSVATNQPRIEDLAEAMGLERAQVEKMLFQVRHEQLIKNEPRVRRKKRILATLAIIGGIAVWAFILVGVYQFGFGEGRRTSAFNLSGPLIERPNLIPAGVQAEFRGYTLVGTAEGNFDLGFVESALTAALRRVVEEQAPVAYDPTAPAASINPSQVRQHLAEGKSLDGAFRFEPVTLRYNGLTDKVEIPIQLSGSLEVSGPLEQEVNRRVRVAASKLVKMMQDGGASGTPAPAPVPSN